MNSGVSASNASASWSSEAGPDGVVPPHVAAGGHRDGVQLVRGSGPVDHQDVLDGVVAGDGGVRVVLDRHGGAAAELAVGGDQELGAGVLHPELQGLGGEAAEDQGMDGADAGHGEGDDHGFGDDGEVDDHPVALGDAEVQEGIGGFGDLALEFGVGDGAAVAGLALEVQGHLVSAPRRYVAVDAVVGDIEPAPFEPGDLRSECRPRRRPGPGGARCARAWRAPLRRRAGPPSRGGEPGFPRTQPSLPGQYPRSRRRRAGEGGLRRWCCGDAPARRRGRRALRRPWARSGTIPKSRERSRARHAALLRSPSRPKWFVGMPRTQSGQRWAGRKNSQGSLLHSIGPGSSTPWLLRLPRISPKEGGAVAWEWSSHVTGGCCGVIDPGLSAARDGHYLLELRCTIPQNRRPGAP